MLFCALALVSCSTQTFLTPQAMQSVIDKKEFDFNATSAYPMNNDAVNILNSLPGAAAGRLLRLDPGYGFNLRKNLFSVYLPYFGRAYSSNPGYASNGGIKFESKDFTLKQSVTKKGNTLFIITPNDQNANYVFNLEMYKNGSAFLSINSNDRQPISFDGNISAAGN